MPLIFIHFLGFQEKCLIQNQGMRKMSAWIRKTGGK